MQLALDLNDAYLRLIDENGDIRWKVGIDAWALQQACFREAFLWRPSKVACVGAYEHVWFFELASGALRLHLNLNELHPSPSSLFGHFGHATLSDGADLLIILGYCDVIALDTSLSIKWKAQNIAIDGLTGADGCSDDDTLIVQAEMDPPGGWFEVTLDAHTGLELRRSPKLSQGYSGIYGVGLPKS